MQKPEPERIGPRPINRCVWCGHLHETSLLLCPEHEEQAKEMRRYRGEPIRGE